MRLVFKDQKTLLVRETVGIADGIAPNYIFGCGSSCSNNCYMKKLNEMSVRLSTNIKEINNAVFNWSQTLPTRAFNSQGLKSLEYLVDIGSKTDLGLHFDIINTYYEYDSDNTFNNILKFYDDNKKLNSIFSTIYPNNFFIDVSDFNKRPKIIVRLMPQALIDLFEYGSNNLEERIYSKYNFDYTGWDMYFHLGPIIITDNWVEDWRNIFQMISLIEYNNPFLISFMQSDIRSTVRTTYAQKQYLYDMTENNNSPNNLSYKLNTKMKFLKKFKNLSKRYLDNEIILTY